MTHSLPMLSVLFIFCLIFPLAEESSSSSPQSLLALNCGSPSRLKRPPLHTLFSNLTSQLVETRFIASTGAMGLVVMQCRLNLSPTRCAICAQSAARTVSTLCPRSNSVAAWFDCCYLHYDHHPFDYNFVTTSTNMISCSTQVHVPDRVQFQVALETLFLRMRAEINFATHHRFSIGEATYADHGTVYGLAECVRLMADHGTVYGLAECVRLMSPEECGGCVEECAGRLRKRCGGGAGGTAVAGNCVVRFESYRFFSYGGAAGGPEAGGGTAYDGTPDTGGAGGGGSMSFKAKVGLGWGVGVACLIGVVLSVWLMRRSVVNTAKVSTLGQGGDGNHK